MKSTILYYFLIIGIFLVSACGGTEESPNDGEETTEESVNITELLQGKWESTEVKRSGNPTDMGPFSVEYSADGTFKSDIFDANQQFPFMDGVISSIEGRTLSFEEITDTFHINEIDESTLVLSTSIRNFPFEFVLEKK